jgi:hypothetical protein
VSKIKPQFTTNKPHLIQEPKVTNLNELKALTSFNEIKPKITIIIYEYATIQTAIRFPQTMSKIHTETKFISGKNTSNNNINDITQIF